jgi:hydrogenase maturation protease
MARWSTTKLARSFVDLLDGAEAVILIDAVRSGALSGTIHEFSIDEVDRRAARFVSSHDLGVAAAIQLARKLGRGPFVGRVIGIEIAPGSTAQLSGLSARAREAVRRAVERVRSAAVELDARERERFWN